MSTLQQYVYIIGGFQGCLLFGLLMFDSRVSGASRILGIWCLFLGLVFLGPFTLMSGEVNVFSWWIGWFFFLPASYGALLYLYCRNSVLRRKIELPDLLHFAPVLLCYLLNVDILFMSGAEKLAYIQSEQAFSSRMQLAFFIMFAQAFFYAGLTAVSIQRYQREARHTLSTFDPAIFTWLWVIMSLNFLIWCLKAASNFLDVHASVSIMSDVFIVIFIYSVAMAQWRNPLLFNIDQLSDAHSVTTDPNDQDSSESNGALDAETRSSILETVKRHVEHRALYRDSKLTLSSLAAATDLSTHHLSEVLNQQEGKNFYQFINEYRVEDVCRRLQEDGSQKVLDIAMEAGFSSKSTFNSIFKQFTGATPTQYRNALSLPKKSESI